MGTKAELGEEDLNVGLSQFILIEAAGSLCCTINTFQMLATECLVSMVECQPKKCVSEKGMT